MSTTKHDEVINFRALQLANEHRSAYGLRYNDYNRYRNHCVNRTHRLRSNLKITHGKGREFKKLPPLSTENLQAGHLQLLLFETERCWAYSQELYLASSQPSNSDKAAKLRHSSTARFRRSVHWATEALSHCQVLYSNNRLSAENLLEMTVYTLILNGRFLRFREDFEVALNQLCVAREILDILATNAETSRDQALATLFSDEVSPEIRHCAHELGHTKSYEIDAIVKEISPKYREELVGGYGNIVGKLLSEGSASSRNLEGRKRLKPILWEGLEVPVRNPELVDVLLKVQEAEGTLMDKESGESGNVGLAPENVSKGRSKGHKSRSGVAVFDNILLSLSDAEETARKLAEAQQISGSTSSGSPGNRDIHFVHSFIVFQLLSRRIQRDLTLISIIVSHSTNAKQNGLQTMKGKTDARINPAVVKVLDTVLQSLTQMRILSVIDESPDLANAVEARLAFTKGRRCLYLSRSYAAVKKYAEALTLTQRARLYLREASSLLILDADPINTGSPSFYTVQSSSFTDLESLLSSDEIEYKQDWFTLNGGSISSEKDTSKKPVFFDIALNYIQLDMDRLRERAGTKKYTSDMPAAAEITKTVAVEPKAIPTVAKAKMEEIQRPATPEQTQPARGLGSLLGGWWGRK